MDPGPISSILLQSSTAIPALLLSAIYFLQTILHPLDTFNPLCSAKPMRLTTSLNSWGKVSWLFVTGSTLLLTPVVRPATSRFATPSEATPFSYWSIKPWFYKLRETCCCAHHTFLLGFTNYAPSSTFLVPLPYSRERNQAFFWRRCRGERSLLQGESLALNLFILLLFLLSCFTLFCLLHYIKNPKKK